MRATGEQVGGGHLGGPQRSASGDSGVGRAKQRGSWFAKAGVRAAHHERRQLLGRHHGQSSGDRRGAWSRGRSRAAARSMSQPMPGLFYTTTDLGSAGRPTVWNFASEESALRRGHGCQAGCGRESAFCGLGRLWSVHDHRAAPFARCPDRECGGLQRAAHGAWCIAERVGSAGGIGRSQDVTAPVLDASETASQIQVPFEAQGSTVSLSLQARSGPLTFGVPLKSASPAIFVDPEGTPLIMDASQRRAVGREESRARELADPGAGNRLGAGEAGLAHRAGSAVERSASCFRDCPRISGRIAGRGDAGDARSGIRGVLFDRDPTAADRGHGPGVSYISKPTGSRAIVCDCMWNNSTRHQRAPFNGAHGRGSVN